MRCHPGVDVIFQRQCHHICLQTVCHFQRLLARTAVGLYHFYILSGLFFPMLCKNRIIFGIQLSGGVIGNIDDADGIAVSAAAQHPTRQNCRQQQTDALFDLHMVSLFPIQR